MSAKRPSPEWQPISTAPTGVLLLICSMTATEAKDWCVVDWFPGKGPKLSLHPKYEPTHWMPLPDPPVEGEKGYPPVMATNDEDF